MLAQRKTRRRSWPKPTGWASPASRIALVHHTPGFFEANDMIDLVAGNRGLNVKNFPDVESALAWLE